MNVNTLLKIINYSEFISHHQKLSKCIYIKLRSSKNNKNFVLSLGYFVTRIVAYIKPLFNSTTNTTFIETNRMD